MAEQVEDTRRLDWLSAEDRRVMATHYYNAEKGEWFSKWRVGGTLSCPEVYSGDTLREVIDFAIAAEETPALTEAGDGTTRMNG